MTGLRLPTAPGHLAGHTLTRYIAAELPTREAERVQRHLVTCPRCARAYEEQQFAHHTLRALALDRPIPGHLDAELRRQLARGPSAARARPLRFLRAAAEIRHEKRPPPPAPARRSSPAWAVAAVLMLALTSALVFSQLGSRAVGQQTGQRLGHVPPEWYCAPPPTGSLANNAAWSASHISLNDLQLLTPSTGWAVGEYVGSRGAILSYVAGSWNLDTSTAPAVLRSISMDETYDGWAVGEDCARPGHAFMMHFDGSDWLQVDSPAFSALSSVAMVSPSDGWAVGPQTLLHYDGVSWTEVPVQGGTGATSLALPAEQSGWAVGSSGTILQGAGQQWVSRAGGNGPDLNGISFSGANEGWAVGGYTADGGPGALAHFHNGQWSLLSAPVSDTLFGVCMVSPSEGWAVGGIDIGVVLHYLHGHWSIVPTHGLPGLRAVAMISPSEGWAVGAEGALVHYSNGVWDQQARAAW